MSTVHIRDMQAADAPKVAELLGQLGYASEAGSILGRLYEHLGYVQNGYRYVRQLE